MSSRQEPGGAQPPIAPEHQRGRSEPLRPPDAHRSASPPPAQVFFRPLGMAMPLGYQALVAASAVLAADHLGWIATTQAHHVALMLLVFTVPIQAIVSIFGFLSRDTQIGVEMGILSGAWAAIGVTMLLSPPGSISGALGVVLVSAGFGLAGPIIAATRTRLAPAAVITLAALHLLADGAYQLGAGGGAKTATGIIGLLLAIVAFYTAIALQVEEATGRTILWLGRRGSGETAVHGTWKDQIAGVANSPGVRSRF